MSSKKHKKRNKMIALVIVLALVVPSMTALLSVVASML